MRNEPHQQKKETLSKELQKLRLQRQKTIADVAGAVEVDIEVFARFENGEDTPSEEILLLLISYFELSDTSAAKLWRLAGFSRDEQKLDDLMDALQDAGAFALPQDAKIAYTDIAQAHKNDHGIVLNFMQSGGPMGKPLVVSRLGMSTEHAKNIVKLLLAALQENPSNANSVQRLLEPPQDSTDKEAA